MTMRNLLAATLVLASLPALADEQWPARLVTGGTNAGAVMLGPQQVGAMRGGSYNATPRFVNMTTSTAGATACASTDGKYATDGTQSWEPSCFGTFLSPFADIRVFPTRGTTRVPTPNNDGPPDPNFKAMTHSLIQVQGNGAVRQETTGQFINLDVVGGPVSAEGFSSGTNTVGQLISVRQRPGPNGERPATTWGQNIDFHIGPGSGFNQSWGVEYDMNNFSQPCLPLSDCISSAMFFNGIGTTNTAWLYSGGGTTNTFTGTVNVSNGVATWLSETNGHKFDRTQFYLIINGTYYRADYISPTQMNITVPIADMTNASYTSKNAMTYYGIFFQGDNSSQESDIQMNTYANNGVNIGGNHRVAFNSSQDQGPYSLSARAGQSVCFDSFQHCFQWNAAQQRLLFGAGFSLSDAGSMQLAQGLLVDSVNTNAFRLARSVTPASSSSPCLTGDMSWDASYTYVCVATNTWKRAALSSW